MNSASEYRLLMLAGDPPLRGRGEGNGGVGGGGWRQPRNLFDDLFSQPSKKTVLNAPLPPPPHLILLYEGSPILAL
jgi:hypothetical protein